MINKVLVVLATVWLGCLAASAGAAEVTPFESWRSAFDRFVRTRMPLVAVPGMAVAIVTKNGAVYVKEYGFADLEAKRAVTEATVFHIASMSKVFTGTALMRLWQDRAFKLDQNIDTVLPFRVSNPHHPQDAITFRQLATHTSSIDDLNYNSHDFSSPGDSPIRLEAFLRGYLLPGGRWYSADGSFSDHHPGERYSYSNVATALAGYTVERLSGAPLDKYSKQVLFDPLGMTHTSWHLSDTQRDVLAVPYDYRDGRYVRLPPGGYPDWPAGLLRSSITDLARFLTMFLNQGRFGVRQILSADTVRMMLDPQITTTFATHAPYQSLFWSGENFGGKPRIGHYGGDPGVSTAMFFDPEAGIGVIVLTNASVGEVRNDFKDEVITRLFRGAEVYQQSAESNER